ncbi:putative methyltransferase PMT23 [Acorus gramineus]|uniref:Methyltransferase n=1 Tax=Acorus gramineus TaxID=55184 RepID=A0AAV9AJV3_ACOGR|nr:putative methyltransferase PMT23 [Acorus gramineus]
MSIAPKDEHEAQIQFALERGIPAVLSVIGTQRLTFSDNVYDIIHCARCRVHREADEMAGDWANIPDDLLWMILKRIDHEDDYRSFRIVINLPPLWGTASITLEPMLNNQPQFSVLGRHLSGVYVRDNEVHKAIWNKRPTDADFTIVVLFKPPLGALRYSQGGQHWTTVPTTLSFASDAIFYDRRLYMVADFGTNGAHVVAVDLLHGEPIIELPEFSFF